MKKIYYTIASEKNQKKNQNKGRLLDKNTMMKVPFLPQKQKSVTEQTSSSLFSYIDQTSFTKPKK